MQTIEHRKRLADAKCQAVGMHGEYIAANYLRDRGYIVEMMPDGSKCGDLRCISPHTGETISVEVKTARRGTEGWRFTLRKRGKTNHLNADLVLLLAVVKVGPPIPFLIPVEDIRDISAIKLRTHPLHYNGRYSDFRVTWRCIRLERAL